MVWHPADVGASALADAVVDHFHGTPFSGLIGGAVEVLTRSEPWDSPAPRPLPFADADVPAGLTRSACTAVVPIIGNEMAMAVQNVPEWRAYMERIRDEAAKQPDSVFVFPYQLDHGAMHGTEIGNIFEKPQRLGATAPEGADDPVALMCRELSQGIAQSLSPKKDDRLQVFISHTKHARKGDEEDTRKVVELVRDVVAKTRLREFFDTHDLQPGQDWDRELRENAGSSALLAIRTDLYPSREWCQREVRIAKENGMPVIFLDAPGPGEERGSFLMDHVPRIPVGKNGNEWNRTDVYRALNVLVDEALKRSLWRVQKELAQNDGGSPNVTWWAPHAPEPVTVLSWLSERREKGIALEKDENILVLHPDPPLGPDERLVLNRLMEATGTGAILDVATPRTLAARGG